MKQYLSFTAIVLLLVTFAVSTGCDSGDEPIPSEEESRIPISFSTEESSSRGIAVSAYSMSEFPLKGYVVDSYKYMDVTVRRRSDGSWGTDVPYYWPPRGESMQFCAVYGAPSSEFLLVNSWENNPQLQTYYYSVKRTVSDQKDIIYALSEVCNYHAVPDRHVRLNFRHVLASVKLNIVGDITHISSIEFRNLWGSGVFSPDKMSWELKGPWGGDAEKHTYVIPVDGKEISEENRTMFLIPQLTPFDATVAITHSDGSVKEQPFSWHNFFMEANNTVTITLSQ